MAPAAVDDQNVPPPTLETSLGVVGSLRVRAYGNVKHAHLILKKVDEEEFEDSSGRKRKRGVFSLFAQKLINVKAGKELFLYLQPANGDVQERCIALEGELLSADDVTGTETTVKDTPAPAEKMDIDARAEEKIGKKTSEKVGRKETVEKVGLKAAESAMSIDTKLEEPALVPAREQVLPPKMRKLWSRKSMPYALDPLNELGACYIFVMSDTPFDHCISSHIPSEVALAYEIACIDGRSGESIHVRVFCAGIAIVMLDERSNFASASRSYSFSNIYACSHCTYRCGCTDGCCSITGIIVSTSIKC